MIVVIVAFGSLWLVDMRCSLVFFGRCLGLPGLLELSQEGGLRLGFAIHTALFDTMRFVFVAILFDTKPGFAATTFTD